MRTPLRLAIVVTVAAASILSVGATVSAAPPHAAFVQGTREDRRRLHRHQRGALAH